MCALEMLFLRLDTGHKRKWIEQGGKEGLEGDNVNVLVGLNKYSLVPLHIAPFSFLPPLSLSHCFSIYSNPHEKYNPIDRSKRSNEKKRGSRATGYKYVSSKAKEIEERRNVEGEGGKERRKCYYTSQQRPISQLHHYDASINKIHCCFLRFASVLRRCGSMTCGGEGRTYTQVDCPHQRDAREISNMASRMWQCTRIKLRT
jgi:hypothetical protein